MALLKGLGVVVLNLGPLPDKQSKVEHRNGNNVFRGRPWEQLLQHTASPLAPSEDQKLGDHDHERERKPQQLKS